MSQKFVMLFLVSRTQTVTLDAAAKILIEESQDSSSHSKYKSEEAQKRTSWSASAVSPVPTSSLLVQPKCGGSTTLPTC